MIFFEKLAEFPCVARGVLKRIWILKQTKNILNFKKYNFLANVAF